MRFLKTFLVSALAALAAAHTEPDYTKNPEGNAISKPGLNEAVPAGKPYTITWEPTTKGPVSLVLLRGPSNNVQPIATIAEQIENSGKYEWTPSTSLEPDVTHYGLLIVVEGTGQYQWSTQFGISNKDFAGSPSATKTTPRSSTDVISKEKTTTLPETSSAPAPTTTTTSTTSTTSSVSTSSSIIVSSSVSRPPKFTAAPTTLHSAGVPTAAPSATTTDSPPMFTNGADRNAISFGGLALGIAAILAI